jgi:hypothetical protein
MRTREDAGKAILGGALVVVLTVLGLMLMDTLGGFAGSLTFVAFGMLWVLFGLAIAIDFFQGALRRR